MPLVTVKCTHKYFVPDEVTEADATPQQLVTLRLLDDLPDYIAGRAVRLGLGDDITPDKVVVDLVATSRHSRNMADIWVKFEPCKAVHASDQEKVRDKVGMWLHQWFTWNALEASWDFDVLFSDGRGYSYAPSRDLEIW